ncbi:MAG: septal ring lytic transglycosylase RlpA family protein [Solirubrobacteraceae bacterium]
MRPRFALRTTRTLHAIAAAGTVAAAGSAATVALLATPAPAAAKQPRTASVPGTRTAVQLRAEPARVGFGHAVTFSGRAPRADAHSRALLLMEPSPGAPWSPVAGTTIGRRGRFQFRVHPARSARYRALVRAPVSGAATAPGAGALAPAEQSQAAPAPALALAGLRSSPARAVTVLARFSLRHSRLDLLGRGRVHVTGRVVPGLSGRLVRLQSATGAGWRTVARDRTGRRGGFGLAYAAASTARQRLRLALASGDRIGRSVRAVGVVTVLQPSVASWYYDAGATACGFHATYGVANKTLPCGTRVRFRHGSRSVTAVVDDRGPFVAGREWDLSQTTAGALGFAGVGTVWAASW